MSAVKETEVEQQAAAWLVRLDSMEIAPGEKAAFNTWLEAHPRHRVAFLRLQVAWRRVDKLTALGAFDAPSTWSRGPVLAAAAAVLLAVSLSAWFFVKGFDSKTYTTEIGNSGRIVLDDGSTMVLNTNSKVRVSFTREQRALTLVRGEAYFQVAPDTQRPFEVRAGATNIRALGTAFSVRLREREQVEVLVSQGKVAVQAVTGAPAEAAAALTAGETATVTSNGVQKSQLAPLDIPRKLAWQDGLLRFNGETLTQAVAEFNRYNRRQLVIADPAIADLHIGGGFQTTDLNSFLSALETSFHVSADSAPDDVIALRAKSN